MNWVEFSDKHWQTVLTVTILSGVITGLTGVTNIILFPQIENYPVYFFGIQTLILFCFFLFLWFQPKEQTNKGVEK